MDRIITVYLLWASVFAGISGLVFQLVRLVRSTNHEPSSQIHGRIVSPGTGNIVIRRRGFFLTHDPFLLILTILFHFLLFLVPVFLYAHGEMFFLSWGIHLPSLPQDVTHLLAGIVCCTGLVLLTRRLMARSTRGLIRLTDILFLILTLLPFITGFMAYRGMEPYRIIMYIHILSSELLLIMAGWTRLGHMIFFVISRFTINGEYSLSDAGRSWR